ncbi:MAG TPA: RteC domain-containing protein, partial [Puia sp.]
GYDHRARIVKHSIIELKRYIATYPFADQAAEIYCFKHVMPFFLSQYFYFGKVYNAESKRITCGQESFYHFLEDELRKIENRFLQYGNFCQYYYRGSDTLDAQYYTRASWEIWEDQSQFPDDNSSLGSYKASWIMADERYREYLRRELQRPLLQAAQTAQAPPAKWAGTISDAVELLVALQETGSVTVENQPATLVQVKERFQLFVDIDLKDINDTDYKNRSRKKQAAPYLSKLLAKYTERFNRLLG